MLLFSNSEKDGDSIAQPSDEESNHADGKLYIGLK